MGKGILYCLLGLSFMLSGCVVRTYQLTKDRIDQDLSSGNRGYIAGSGQAQETTDRKTTRTTQVVEVEMNSPIKFVKGPGKIDESIQGQQAQANTENEVMGNRGYITQSIIPEIAEPSSQTLQKYVVQKNDTLQKISQKFYGTTKKWNKIYDANRDTLKGPNKIYPGKTINIPVEPGQELKEPPQNLK